VISKLRFVLVHFFFFTLGLRVGQSRRELEALFELSEDDRSLELERRLSSCRPINSIGEEVTSFKDLNSSPPLSKDRFREQCAAEKISKGAAFGRHTAGTTGAPTNVALGRKDLSRMLAVRDYCLRHYGIKLGEREARVWGRPDKGWKGMIRNLVLNRSVFYPVGDKALDEVKRLLRSKFVYMYGYASLILEVARLIEKYQLDPPDLRCIICTAETVLKSQKQYISHVLKAPVIEEYGATEFDIIAFECDEGHRHLVNPWIYVEQSDEGECLISDMERKPKGIVRYQLGDSLKIKRTDCHLLGSTKSIDELEGRSINRFAFVDGGKKFHAVEFARIVEGYQLESGESFGFTIVQMGFGEFELYAESQPEEGIRCLSDYISSEIERRLGYKIRVSPPGNQAGLSSPKFHKAGYFIQNLES
tara:strand:+ start:3632 stop:4888 length:1257 start_codon:yes stop_codon:yes gene_type:complete